mmetsp:Transcript_2379/g.3773  ORF Transcript_2379/g.3773 Transcript_2379/m.3773 type:complete len:138 (+) Transcript_2379:85-498(+)
MKEANQMSLLASKSPSEGLIRTWTSLELNFTLGKQFLFSETLQSNLMKFQVWSSSANTKVFVIPEGSKTSQEGSVVLKLETFVAADLSIIIAIFSELLLIYGIVKPRVKQLFNFFEKGFFVRVVCWVNRFVNAVLNY